MIIIDPNEMSAVSTVLQQCAVEVADIGSQLASCVDCPMPPAVHADVNALIAAIDGILDHVGAALTNEAIGLVGRGIIAMLDSLAAASGVTLSSVGVVGGNSGAGLTITAGDGSLSSALLGGSVIGGSSGPGYTILNMDGSPASSILPGVSVIGGNSGAGLTITNMDGSPATSLGSGLGVIGGHGTPSPGYTFSATPSYGAGSQNLLGISFQEALPNIPAPSGFVPSNGNLANQMAINASLGTFVTNTQRDIRFDGHVTAANTAGITPQKREDFI